MALATTSISSNLYKTRKVGLTANVLHPHELEISVRRRVGRGGDEAIFETEFCCIDGSEISWSAFAHSCIKEMVKLSRCQALRPVQTIIHRSA